MSPSSGALELNTLEDLQAQLSAVSSASQEQRDAQDKASEDLDVELQAIEHALSQLAMLDRQSAAHSELILAPLKPKVSYQLPLVKTQAPLLRYHASERRRTRAFLSAPHWSAKDLECLRLAIENERLRATALHLDPNYPDWNRIASQVPFHTPVDCRTRWRFFERPDVNLSRWGTQEKRALSACVDPTNPSWEEAAESLQTGRTGYAVLEAYRRGTKPAMEWTPERDAELLAAVQMHGPDWKAVVQQLGFPSFCASLCHQRHSKLKSTALRLGRWSSEEDAALRAAVAEYGCDWKRVEIHVPGRSGQQCRERWVGRLANIPEGETQATRRAWLPEEDARLRECVQKYKTWVQVAEHVGGRSDKMVRERWLLLRRRDEEEEKRLRGEPVPLRRGRRQYDTT
ncbi:hypothetical protein MYAM1_002907 [Malassezia yamatoensis]|uniref:Uncharacterized protein n=1 Tax=Malassezia yamatoensis TaxID=253288 RepID=A0AAJ5YTK5_9BASI|nr:hypothetical protein MYAM1_002907 [Malassezia yamatoensis]